MDGIDLLIERLTRIEAALERLERQQAKREWYSTDEIAALLGKDGYTVREWCRLSRIKAEKRRSGRGAHKTWAVSHEELERIQREGLLPIDGR